MKKFLKCIKSNSTLDLKRAWPSVSWCLFTTEIEDNRRRNASLVSTTCEVITNKCNLNVLEGNTHRTIKEIDSRNRESTQEIQNKALHKENKGKVIQSIQEHAIAVEIHSSSRENFQELSVIKKSEKNIMVLKFRENRMKETACRDSSMTTVHYNIQEQH